MDSMGQLGSGGTSQKGQGQLPHPKFKRTTLLRLVSGGVHLSQ